MKKILIIGAGPSGIMAAINAAKRGHYIEIWEKNDRPCKKILISGNGRCNITNKNLSHGNYFGKNTKILDYMFSKFNNKDTISFFKEIGLEIVEEDLGRMYPRTFQSVSVYDILVEALKENKIKLLLNNPVINLEKNNNKFIAYSKTGKRETFDCIIISTGGKSYPKLGTTGDGYNFAYKFGHTINSPLPALAPVIIKKKIFNTLQGIKIKAKIKIKNQIFTGDLLFTNYGLSGTTILDLSLPFASYINAGNLDIYINFFPEFDLETIKIYLKKRWEKMPGKTFINSFIGILPYKISKLITSLIPGTTIEKKVSEISNLQLNILSEYLTNFKVSIAGSRGFDEAQVTAGGVDLSEINISTTESKLCRNLYLTGEILDITGMCGGYNLQLAWTTGFIAGTNI